MISGEEHSQKLAEIFFSSFTDKNVPMVLYGLGIHTEKILSLAGDYNIVGLMDAKREGETVFGLPVLSAEEVAGRAKCIVIIAREAVVPIIYGRIAFLWEKGIEIYNIRHEHIQKEVDKSYRLNPYWKQTKEQLFKEIDKHDIISFDIFDTVLIRKVQRPSDIFELVEGKLHGTPYQCSFAALRQKAETVAGQIYPYPTYADIYRCMKEISGMSDETVNFLKNTEFETEKKFINARRTIIEAIKYAGKAGKRVLLLSDMYFTKYEIAELLKPFIEINTDDIFVSSDLKKAKWPDGEAYRYIREMFGMDRSYLHVGDSRGVDIAKAMENGFDAFHVMSEYDMLVFSSVSGILVHVKTLCDSVAIGMLCDFLFNDPFALSETSGQVRIDTSYAYGYLAFGCLVSGVVDWIAKNAEKVENAHIWFMARDGFIIEKVYNDIYRKYAGRKIPKGEYVLASRTALATAAYRDKADIEQMRIRTLSLSQSGAEILEKRFGVKANSNMKNAGIQELLSVYESEILNESAKRRERYLNYLSKFYYEKEKIVLYDSASGGTSAFFMQKILNKDVELYCLTARIVPEYSVVDEINCCIYLGTELDYASAYHVSKKRDILESILTSYAPMFLGFQEDDAPQFSEADKSQENTEELIEAHTGIKQFALDFFQLTEDINGEDLTKNFTDDCFGYFTDSNYVQCEEIERNFGTTERFT